MFRVCTAVYGSIRSEMVWKCFMFPSFSCRLPAFRNSATVPYRSYRQLTLLISFGHFCKLLWYSTWTKSRTDHCFLDDISNFMEGWFFYFRWDRGSVCSLYPVTVSEMVFPAWVWIDFSLVTDYLLLASLKIPTLSLTRRVCMGLESKAVLFL